MALWLLRVVTHVWRAYRNSCNKLVITRASLMTHGSCGPRALRHYRAIIWRVALEPM